MGYSVEDVTAALSLMANAGIKGSAAGTSLRTLMTNLVKPTKSSATAIEELGISMTDSEGNALSLREILIQLREGFSSVGDISEETAARLLSGTDEALDTVDGAGDVFGEAADAVGEAGEEAAQSLEDAVAAAEEQLAAMEEAFEEEEKAKKSSLEKQLEETGEIL